MTSLMPAADSMLSALDDHMVHQTPDPMRVVWTSDPQAYERHWMTCHDDDGELVISVGGSFYPNLDTAEAFAIVNLRGRHVAVRSFRRLGFDRMDMHVGPIRPAVVDGMRRWRYELDENEFGVTFDFEFTDVTRQVLRQPLIKSDRHAPGRQPQVTAGFESFGEVEGWVDVSGERIALDRARVRGSRDRHWGTGRGVGGPLLNLGRTVSGGHSGNAFVMFDDYGIWGDRVFYRFDDPRSGAGTATVVDRQLRFEPDTHIFMDGIVDVELSHAGLTRLHFRRFGHQTTFLRCGMYGGTPDRLRYQGVYPGSDLTEGSVHDVSDPTHRVGLAGLDEHQCMVTRDDGDTVTGIFQPIDPMAFEFCRDGRPGWRFLSE